jgi:hypothetical protein
VPDAVLFQGEAHTAFGAWLGSLLIWPIKASPCIHRFTGTERSNMKKNLTEQERFEYKLYRKACRVQGVEPVYADFLAGDIPSCVTNWMKLERNDMKQGRRKVMGAAAGAKRSVMEFCGRNHPH